METQQFRQWAILEVMGHQVYAGIVSSEAVGGASLVRVDVPEVDGQPAFSKLFGAASIYCITPVSEEVARMRAASLRQEPLSVYDLPNEIRERLDRMAIEDRSESDELTEFDEE